MAEMRKRLVVVDDSSVELMIFRTITKELDCEALITESYDDAVAYCQEHQVHVIISDLNLGSQSGFDLIAAAKENPENGDTKTFICSSESFGDYKEKMKAANIGWIVKPVEAKSMRKALEKMLLK